MMPAEQHRLHLEEGFPSQNLEYRSIHPMHFLVTGSRDWDDFPAVQEELERFPGDAILVHGGCRGADTIAATLWGKMGRRAIACPVTPDDWKAHGRAAGPMRNARMVNDYPIAQAVAFRMTATGGTAHTVQLLRARGIPLVERWPGGRVPVAEPTAAEDNPACSNRQTTLEDFFGKREQRRQ
jgi:hypothetical protein